MNKARKAIIDAQTAHKVKSMSVASLSEYLYKIYLMGYADGVADKITGQTKPGPSEKR